MVLSLNGPVEEVFASARHDRIARTVIPFLQNSEPHPVFDLPEDTLRATVLDAIRCAETLGIDRISAHKRFAYLWMLSDGALGTEREALDFIRLGGPDPNRQVEALMRHTIAAIRTNSGGEA